MSEELKLCPFCGCRNPRKVSSHSKKCLFILMGKQIADYIAFWKSGQARPLEDALRKERDSYITQSVELHELCESNQRMVEYWNEQSVALRKQLDGANQEIENFKKIRDEKDKSIEFWRDDNDALRKQLEVAKMRIFTAINGTFTWGQQRDILVNALAEIEKIRKEG